MMRKLRLIAAFYQSHATAGWIITLSCASIAYTHGLWTVTALFWFKVLSMGVITYFIANYKRDEFYYYKNLGVTKLQLWLPTMLLDMGMFISLLTLALTLR